MLKTAPTRMRISGAEAVYMQKLSLVDYCSTETLTTISSMQQ